MTSPPPEIDPDIFTELDQETSRIIKEYGHQVISVALSQDSPPDAIPFSYTVGLAPAHPELFITGQLDPITMHQIIEDVADLLTATAEHRPLTPGDVIPNVLGDDYLVKIVPVDPQAAEMFQALRFAAADEALGGPPLQAWQILWPDKLNRFPDDPDYTHDLTPQPTFPPTDIPDTIKSN